MEFKTGLSALSSLVKSTSLAGVGQTNSVADRLGSFGDSLRQGLKSGKIDADVSLGNTFMDAMSGEMGKELASLTEANQLVDALMGQSSGGVPGGGMDGLMGGGLLPGLGGPGGQDLFMELLQAQAKYIRTEEVAGHADGHGAIKAGDGRSRSVAETLAETVRDVVSTRGEGAIREMDLQTIPAMDSSAADGPDGLAEASAPAQRADALADTLEDRMAERADEGVEDAESAAPVLRPMEPVGGHFAVNTGMPPSISLSSARRAMAAKVYGAAQQRTSLGRLLAARFESGGDPAAIGFDRVGGTSYGMYQIASRTGAFDEFLDFLDGRAPDFAQTLRGAGRPNTGSRAGAVPDAWKGLAAQHPDRFKDLQHQFISQNHFQPAANKIQELTGLDVRGLGPALSEVLFSTAVQHGASGSASIFAKAAEKAGAVEDKGFARKWITEIYTDRGKRFGSSSDRVQSAVRSRLQEEMRAALQLLTATAGLDTHA